MVVTQSRKYKISLIVLAFMLGLLSLEAEGKDIFVLNLEITNSCVQDVHILRKMSSQEVYQSPEFGEKVVKAGGGTVKSFYEFVNISPYICLIPSAQQPEAGACSEDRGFKVGKGQGDAKFSPEFGISVKCTMKESSGKADCTCESV